MLSSTQTNVEYMHNPTITVHHINARHCPAKKEITQRVQTRQTLNQYLFYAQSRNKFKALATDRVHRAAEIKDSSTFMAVSHRAAT